MVVDRAHSLAGNRRGQSVLEFLLVTPILFGMTMLMIRVNSVTQMAIVNQRYAREQLMFIAGNGADYPRRPSMVSEYATNGGNVLTIGVSDTPPPSGDTETESIIPATTYSIARTPASPQGDNSTKEPTQRTNIRIRNTVSICMPFISNGGQPVIPVPQNGAISNYGVPNAPQGFAFCSTTETWNDQGSG